MTKNYSAFSEAKPWLSDVSPNRSGPLPADKDEEAYCTLCGARVTVGPDGTEYGHFGDCDHRPNKFANSANHKKALEREKCEECGRGFLNPGALHNHMASIHGDRVEHECPTCEESFETARGVKVHHYRTHGDRLDATETCAECGDEFERAVGSTGQTFCSRACRDASMRDHVTRECAECGDEFSRPASVDTRFCSHACAFENQREREERTCPCGTTFEVIPSSNKRHCSQSCGGYFSQQSTASD